ncbi:MAG: SRPBCC domain-containing protein [Bdellovibrionales bacterium]|nr:SRPBCC domain-containing protein [Bdellovibrionales bacterium]
MSEPKIKVKVSHRYNATPGRVFQALLDPEKAKTFMFATMTGKMIKAEIDAREGGAFTFIDRRPGGDAEHYGKYLKIDAPKHLAFEFAVQKNAKEGDLVTIDIKELPKGCEVVLTHEISADYADLKDRVEEGWDGILDGLGAALRTR